MKGSYYIIKISHFVSFFPDFDMWREQEDENPIRVLVLGVVFLRGRVNVFMSGIIAHHHPSHYKDDHLTVPLLEKGSRIMICN